MNYVSVIEKIRLKQSPTLTTGELTAPTTSSKGGLFADAKVHFEWYESCPLSLVMVFPPQGDSETTVWEFSRELVHFALTHPGHEFGLHDVTVAALTPTPVLVSLRDPGDNSWHTYEIPAGSLADLMRQARQRSPLPKDFPVPLPYTRRQS